MPSLYVTAFSVSPRPDQRFVANQFTTQEFEGALIEESAEPLNQPSTMTVNQVSVSIEPSPD